LRFVGHVGGGFSDRELDRVARLLAPLETASCPFDRRPPTNERPHWTRPELVAEVRFFGRTNDGILRAPIFLGLRDDVRSSNPSASGWARRRRVAPEAIAASSRAEAPAGKPLSRAVLARVRDQLEALAAGRGGGLLELPDGGPLRLTNLAKPLWPVPQIRKADLFHHYLDVAPYILPVVRDRPLVLRRLPDGVDGHAFFQHRAPDDAPIGVRRQAVPDDDVPTRIVGGNLTTLLYLVQLAVVSQDPWFSRVQSPHELDSVAIDLDPMPGASFARVRDVARWVRDDLEGLGVSGYLKTSGARGLHIYVPMRPGTSYESGLLFCRLVATVVAGRHSEATIARSIKRRDASAVYLDCLQNGFGKTLACAYSARASAFAGVSTPLTWPELDDRALDPRDFTVGKLAGRLRDVGDLWARLRKAKGIDLDETLERARSKHGAP
jgi:bifunctional non-homologous end joining protein LigD